MDPNQTLEDIRQSVKDIQEADSKDDTETAALRGADLAAQLDHLDNWILGGGFLPGEWSKNYLPNPGS